MTQGTSSQKAGVCVGTLKYIAPLSFAADDLHPSCDVGRSAVIAYEMLTGSHPLAGCPSPTSRRWRRPVDRHHGAADQRPDRWLTLFRRVLALEPGSRPDTPGQLFAELEQALRTLRP